MVLWFTGSLLEAMDSRVQCFHCPTGNHPDWVRLLGLPISFWTEEIFQEISSALGHFYEVDLSYKRTGYMAMDHILVDLKLENGLVDYISIQHQGHTFTQELDYEGIPFRCGRYHVYGHLAKDCPLTAKKRKWVKK
jgi:hypothetical protein